jgi:hypothetical protein
VHISPFFKLFPPPKFLLMSHAGLDITDHAVRFIEYSHRGSSLVISKYGRVDLPLGMIEGGEVKDEKKFVEIFSGFVREHALSYAKISIPEEKTYLFETDVPYGDSRAISQNIDFKLEQNIPLSAADAVFVFDLLPVEAGKSWRASVSAVQTSYLERMIRLLRETGIVPISFDTVPRAVARIVSAGVPGPSIVIHCLAHKTGVYVVSEHAVGFTSTISDVATGPDAGDDISARIEALAAEVHRVYTYWLSKDEAAGIPVKRVIVAGADTERIANLLRPKVSDIVEVEIVDVWRAVFNIDRYVPPIGRSDSPEYVSAAGLAL